MTRAMPVRDAATVVLLRDGAEGLEAWMLTRATALVFAGGMAVFPGGRVDPSDAALPMPPQVVEAAAQRFGCDPAQATLLLGAAVRELFEETGVLLTVPAADLRDERAAVEAGERRFGDLLAAHELTLGVSALHPWARWVTPEGEVRRYDARFFLAALPGDAHPQDVTTESSSAGWYGVGAALEQAQRGTLGLLPPTIVTLTDLAGFDTVAEAIAAAPQRSLDPVSPIVSRGDDGSITASLPDGRSFPLPRSLFPA